MYILSIGFFVGFFPTLKKRTVNALGSCARTRKDHSARNLRPASYTLFFIIEKLGQFLLFIWAIFLLSPKV